MDSATFTYKEDKLVKLGDAVRMVLLKDKHVVDAGLTAQFVAARRSFFYNRRPAIVAALTRKGGKEDAELAFEVSGLFATYDNDAALAVGRKGEVALLELKVNADGQSTLSKVEGSVAKEIVAATFLTNSLESVALLANGSVVKISADLKTVTELRKETSTKGTFIAAADDYVLVPSKDGVDIISIATKKSSLNAPWVPHSQSEPIIAAYVFRKWKPTGGSNVVMTVGANGREVRLWTGLGNGSLELAANLALDIPKDAEKRVAVADQEENVLITFGTTVLVLSTDEKKIRFSRATEWQQDAAGAFCAYNETTKSGDYQLSMVTRSSDCITAVRLPPSIFGEANLSAEGTTAPKTATHDREPKYFAAAAPKDTSSAVQVHSSLAPAGADSAHVEKAAALSIATVSAEVVRKVNILNGVSASTQNDLSSFITSLQSQSTQAAAAKQGRDHASRNSSRFTNQQAGAAPAPRAQSTTASAGKNVEQLTIIAEYMRGAVQTAIVNRSETALANKVKDAVSSVSGDTDLADLPLPKLSSVPAMQAFNTNIDKALKGQNDYLKSEADTRASTYNAQVVRSGTTTRQSIAESKKFLADLKSELAGLTKDIDAVKVELTSSTNRDAIGAVSSTNVVEDAVALVEKKSYDQAVQQITQAKNVQLLLEFIGHPIVKQAADADAFAPGSISVPAFGMLVHQLAADIESSKGQIAPRVAFLFALCMSWDDYIDETIDGTDAKAKGLLTTLAPSMSNARANVESLSNIKGDISIETRRQSRTLARILAKLE